MRLGFACLGLVAACSFAFSGCGGDDDGAFSAEASGNGGTAGDAGRGGSSAGRGGSGAEGGSAGEGGGGTSNAGSGTDAGRGGRGGSSGRGGTGGTANPGAGRDAGGEAGGGAGGEPSTAGSSGSSGTAGASGGGGTSGESGASGAGAGNESGAGGEANLTPTHCSYGCDHDDDCDGPANLTCNLERGRCEDARRSCTVNADCIPWASTWLLPCADETECYFPDETCVDVGGRGLCVAVVDCRFNGGSEITRQKFPSLEEVTVCANLTGYCERNQCDLGCGSDDDCGGPREGGATCNTETGHCGGCTSDTDCNPTLGTPHCNTETGSCECVSSDDCSGVPRHKVCVSGVCSCSDPIACTATQVPNATPLCE